MKLGIMQPYFFPYLGHFALIAATDQWIIFDVTQYTPRTWMNRNKILHPQSGTQDITVPLSQASISIKTSEATILDVPKTLASLMGKISHYRKKAPYFRQVQQLIETTFDGLESNTLVELNARALKTTCTYLGIPFHYQICSTLGLDFPDNLQAGQWAPFICEKLGATEYINPLGGSALFNMADFEKIHVRLSFCAFKEYTYPTPQYTYQPHLSIVDVMMWNAPDTIRQALQQHTEILAAPLNAQPTHPKVVETIAQ